jgi:hypothetical protein
MAEATAAVENFVGRKGAQAVKSMQVLVSGRIEASRRFDGRTLTHVLTPAPDAYSRPQLLEIRSTRRLGDKGEEITVTCQLGGYQRKAFQTTDKETGERVTVVPVDHTLDLIEQ